MFNYYMGAEICLAYLFDVSGPYTPSKLLGSSWFTRIWTLQELIAPREVELYEASWQMLGTRSSPQIGPHISQLTQINGQVFDRGIPLKFTLSLYSIAEKMSWVCNRTASREEDVAYGLLGIFDVKMPLLYGERERAFTRLQEEIMKNSDEHTLFAWNFRHPYRHGLLASSPSQFAPGRTTRTYRSITEVRSPYIFTNRGLSIILPLIPWSMNVYVAVLDVFRVSRLGIFLHRLQEADQYARVRFQEDFVLVSEDLLKRAKPVSLFVKQQAASVDTSYLYGFWFRTLPIHHELQYIRCKSGWDDLQTVQLSAGECGTIGILHFTSFTGNSILKFGYDSDFNTNLFLHGALWDDRQSDERARTMVKLKGRKDPFVDDINENSWMSECRHETRQVPEFCFIRLPRVFGNDGFTIESLLATIIVSEEVIDGVVTRIVDIHEHDRSTAANAEQYESMPGYRKVGTGNTYAMVW
jgi:hypothetical protein